MLGFTDKRQTSGAATLPMANPANYVSISAMRTRLAAINPTYFTTARLNAMNDSDLTYALRLADDPAGVK